MALKQPELADQPAVVWSGLQKQVAGDHYRRYPLQPVEYCIANKLGFLEGNVIKYVTRHGAKGKAEDIRKAIHYLELILEFEYGIKEEKRQAE